MTARLKGLIPNTVTPMNEQGRPDATGIRNLTEFLINSGVGGLWVLGSAGEDVHVGLNDRIQVVKETVRAAAGRVPVIAGIGPSCLTDALWYAEALGQDQPDAYHSLPYDLKMDDATLVRHMTRLAEGLPRPLWLYHNPKRGKAISIPVARELREHPKIAGLKMGGYNLSELWSVMGLARDDFQVSGAGGGQMFPLLAMGATIHMTSDANCYPEIFLELWRLFDSGDLDAARAMQRRINALSAAIPRTGNGEYAAEEKYILARRGVIQPHVNPSYRTLNSMEQSVLDKVLKDFGFSWA